MKKNNKKYGVTLQNIIKNNISLNIEEIQYKGYTTYDPGYTANKINKIEETFSLLQKKYLKKFKYNFLKKKGEQNIIRSPLLYKKIFLELAMDKGLNLIISKILKNNYYLNQQNGSINQPNKSFAQSAWHRDLPYQHFVSSHPLALNAIYIIDDFTEKNGATCILPGTHLKEAFPSDKFCLKNSTKVIAKKGFFIILDSMIFHRAGFNNTNKDRRSINQVFSTPIIKQQIYFDNFNYKIKKDNKLKNFLGLNFKTKISQSDYIISR